MIPTLSADNWGFAVDYRLNKDCIMDLALSRFVIKATAEASQVLELDADERTKWSEIAENLVPYPTLRLPFGGMG